MLKIFLCLFVLNNSYNMVMAKEVEAIDLILIEKSKRLMSVFHNNKLIKTYKIALGFSPIGHKTKEGDGKTPEGNYFIAGKNQASKFHLSLKISYPNEKDCKASANPGGDIMIHGLKPTFSWLGCLHTFMDWTKGCVAVTNEEITEIFNATPIGTRVELRP